ncbi:hypothetical protein RCH33_2158 [Flavobacterium daejeonense]|nr:hypothetical protein RCH33_2158 [Flavobacterium daejeonense]
MYGVCMEYPILKKWYNTTKKQNISYDLFLIPFLFLKTFMN